MPFKLYQCTRFEVSLHTRSLSNKVQLVQNVIIYKSGVGQMDLRTKIAWIRKTAQI